MSNNYRSSTPHGNLNMYLLRERRQLPVGLRRVYCIYQMFQSHQQRPYQPVGLN